jgi:hypothetical protein
MNGDSGVILLVGFSPHRKPCCAIGLFRTVADISNNPATITRLLRPQLIARDREEGHTDVMEDVAVGVTICCQMTSRGHNYCG